MADDLLNELLSADEDGVLLLSREFEIEIANASAQRLLGRSGIRGMGFAELCKTGFPVLFERVVGAVKEGKNIRRHSIAVGRLACLLSVSPVNAGWVVRLRDATDELSAHYRLREVEKDAKLKQALYLSALQGVSVGILIVDATGKPIHVNRFARAYIADQLHRSSPEKFAEEAGIYEADGKRRTLSKRTLVRALNGETVTNDRFVIRNDLVPSGITAVANATPIRDGDGQIQGAIGWFYPTILQSDKNNEPFIDHKLIQPVLI